MDVLGARRNKSETTMNEKRKEKKNLKEIIATSRAQEQNIFQAHTQHFVLDEILICTKTYFTLFLTLSKCEILSVVMTFYLFVHLAENNLREENGISGSTDYFFFVVVVIHSFFFAVPQ